MRVCYVAGSLSGGNVGREPGPVQWGGGKGEFTSGFTFPLLNVCFIGFITPALLGVITAGLEARGVHPGYQARDVWGPCV